MNDYLGNMYNTNTNTNTEISTQGSCSINACIVDGGGCASISYSNEKTYTAKGCYKTKGVVEKQVLNFIQNSVK
ncbi:hypothetical protein [Cellulosilyticum ruminicola]|uniref:hypothetical protein n=1 Tax=Cellulosilyticum ruminicola TaxID=425254 RepID=UPI0006D0D1A2|nr:hypothetical protein [Cellulosilyticum ruminicola]